MDETPGVHPIYGEYDAVQTARLYNHTALVQEARGGDTVRIRADSKSWVRPTSVIRHVDDAKSVQEKPAMINPLLTALVLRLDSKAPVTAMDETQAIMFVTSRMDTIMESMDEMKEDAEEMMSKEDAEELRGKVDALTAENGELKKSLDQALSYMEKQREDAEMAEVKPMADQMGVEYEKTDSADVIRRRMLARHLQVPLDHVARMDSKTVWGAYAMMRRDSAAQVSTGLQAWQGVMAASQQRTDSADSQKTEQLSPSQLADKRRDAAYANKRG